MLDTNKDVSIKQDDRTPTQNMSALRSLLLVRAASGPLRALPLRAAGRQLRGPAMAPLRSYATEKNPHMGKTSKGKSILDEDMLAKAGVETEEPQSTSKSKATSSSKERQQEEYEEEEKRDKDEFE